MESLDTSSLSEAFKNEESLDKSSFKISQDITNKEYNIAFFVDKLGFALTSSNLRLRVNGTQLFSNVLSNLPRDHLSGEQIEFVAKFYADRMKDQHNILPAVFDGITGLISMKNFPDASVVMILQSFFQNIECQSQNRDDREKIFKMFKVLSENHESVLKSIGGDFINGLISSIESERDPRNLNLIFTFMPDLIKRFPLLNFYEEMFEIFASYFPIDFNPSKNFDGITRDNLASKLSNCMVSSIEFAEWSVPLALEKLESDLIVAKLDCLELLCAMAENYPPNTLEPYFEDIWSAVKNEIFPGSGNQDILNTGLRTLRSILEQASADSKISQHYQTIVLGTVLPHLNDIHQSLFNPSTAIALVCVSGDASFASEKILNSFLLKLHSDEELVCQDKLKIFYILAQVFKLCSLRNAIRQISTKITSELHSEFIKELKNENSPLDLKKAALSCLNESIACTSKENRICLYQCMMQLLTSNDFEIDLKDILKHIAELDSKELQTEFVDNIIRNFPSFSAFVKKKIYRNLLHLIKFKTFSQTVYDLIFSNIFENVSSEVNINTALDALATLLQQENAAFIENLQMNESLIVKISTLMQSGRLNIEILEHCATILNLIVKNLPVAEQYMIISEYLPKLNLELESDLFLTKGLLGFMHQSITIEEHFEQLTNNLIKLSLNNDNEILRTACHHLLCSLFNKMEDNETNRGVLHRIVQKLKEEIEQFSQNAVEILSWIGKGLNVRGLEVASDIIGAIADLLDDPKLTTAANLAFNIISAEYPGIHLPCVMFLFKQKFFNVIYTKIAHKLECFSENHMNAFIYILKSTPHTVLKMNLEKIGPILFKCLESNEVSTVRIALEICNDFIKTKDVYFSGHFNHLVPQCLKLSQYKSSMNVRIDALNLLYEITKYPTFFLLPLKMDVVLGLPLALDDQKRLVRSAAVKTSNAWFIIG